MSDFLHDLEALDEAKWSLCFREQPDTREPWLRANWEKYELVLTCSKFGKGCHQEFTALARFADSPESLQAAKERVVRRCARALLPKRK